MKACLLLALGFLLGCKLGLGEQGSGQQGSEEESGTVRESRSRGRHGADPDLVAVATGKKFCKELAPIYEDVKAAREERRGTKLYRRYLDLLPDLDAPESATPEVLAEARSIRDKYVKRCMEREGWSFDDCRNGDLARPLTERIIMLAMAQKNYALAYAENDLLTVPDQSSTGSEFLGEVKRRVHKNPKLLVRAESCEPNNVWRMPGAGPKPTKLDLRSEILTGAGLDPLHDAGKVYVKGLIRTVGTGTTASITFSEIQRVGLYQDNCRWVEKEGSGGTLIKVCDQKTAVGHEAIPAAIKLTDGEAEGLKPGQIIEAAVHPKTRVGYLIRALGRADPLDSNGSKILKVRGFLF